MILTARGPVVIDWPNAARGPAAADVAHTWIVLACSAAARRTRSGERSRSAGRRLFLALFLRHYSRPELVAASGRRSAPIALATEPAGRRSWKRSGDGGACR